MEAKFRIGQALRTSAEWSELRNGYWTGVVKSVAHNGAEYVYTLDLTGMHTYPGDVSVLTEAELAAANP